MQAIHSRHTTGLGLIAIAFYCIHGCYWIIAGEPSNLLWACHLGSLFAGLGLMLRIAVLNAVGVLWLGLGNAFWLLYLIGGGDFILSSAGTHIGGIIVGIIGVRLLGLPGMSWLWALAGLALLQFISRHTTVAKENINLAFRVHEGWENIFPVFGIYIAFLLVIATLSFISFQWLLAKTIPGITKESGHINNPNE